eukprot:CAMPEP_0175070818 /NCGR_PEP_ID=MMETSP0052_2-20121109/18915_1 /TAXON_ID=51329 ORGANISM="Polytomella parva, Strain SAG 63-3" /NCGR_SAMPLE_ID=MMETSP0052_2 /ASSEMBLY_ACC=CAM_ASM_000194 /LENGTH=375 /DNA_ID=CAMNT_0016337953 /DNA_START=128 /DNA_END=1251 /DNA_ORIENTATION=+
MLEDNLVTTTSKAQVDLEDKVSSIYFDTDFDGEDLDKKVYLNRQLHIDYLYSGLGQLKPGYASLDASKTWICYWILHSLALLEAPLPPPVSLRDIANFFKRCQHPRGGFGGGKSQIAHLATTYAAVCAIATTGDEQIYNVVDRLRLYDFLNRMCIPPEAGGGFSVHDGGECDLRACYTAIATAYVMRLDLDTLVQKSGVVDYIARCQTFEGGLGGEPGNEAHGGYTFCGVAALSIIGRLDAIDLRRLLRWVAARQGSVEGGFNGRTNKLVDGCYSLWQGGLLAILQNAVQERLIFDLDLEPLRAAVCRDGHANGRRGDVDDDSGIKDPSGFAESLGKGEGKEDGREEEEEGESKDDDSDYGSGSASSPPRSRPRR